MEQNKIQIDRPVYTQSSLDVVFKLRQTESPSATERIKQSVKSKCRCSLGQCAHAILRLLPFLGHMKGYRHKWRTFLPGDITAGLSVGIMHIPMGFGYSLLANVPPVYGLYTSFWCVLLYFLFGQSHHASIGTMAIMSIMVAEATNTNAGQVVSNGNKTDEKVQSILLVNETTPTNIENFTMDNMVTNVEGTIPNTIDRTLLVTMLTGMMLLLMSALKLSKVVVFIPTPCISGFTTAAAFHILTSQVKFILGISIQGHTGVFKFVKLWKEIILELPNTNICDLVIFICCFIFLITIKEIVNPKFKHRLPVPIPSEIIVLIVVTLISYLAALSDRFGIKIVDEVPAGFATPTIPNFHGFETHLINAFLIAVISFVISYSMVSTFARNHKYEVDAGQEMLAYGMCHLVGSVFGGFTAAAAPPRCTVLDTTGAKTQLVHVFTSVILLLTILLIGPLFEPLPNSCLATIIVCALIPLFRQFQDLVEFWKINKYDFAIWLLTWASVLFLDIDIGLGIGVGFSITTIALQGCLSKGQTLSLTGNIDLCQPSGKHELSEEIPGIKIFRFNSNLHFASQAQFKEQLFNLTVKPTTLPLICFAENKRMEEPQAKMETDMETVSFSEKNSGITESLLSDLWAIIIDFSSVTYIDVTGLNLIKQLKADYSLVGIDFVLVNCCGATLCTLEAAGIANDNIYEIEIFPTIQDAVTALKYKHGSKYNKTNEHDINFPISLQDNV